MLAHLAMNIKFKGNTYDHNGVFIGLLFLSKFISCLIRDRKQYSFAHASYIHLDDRKCL